MNNIVVTGASGYIGTALTKTLLDKGYNVAYLARRKIEKTTMMWIDSNSDFKNELLSFSPDIIVHLAADYGAYEVEELNKCNLNLPIKIMKCLSELEISKRKFISIGSYWQYGDALRENIPIDLYSASKLALKPFFDYFTSYKNISIIELVIYGTYGEGDCRKKILDLMLDAAKSELPLELSCGEQKLNLLHINDVVKGILQACVLIMNENSYKQYSIYSKEEYSIFTIGRLISKFKNVDLRFGCLKYRDVELFNPVYKNNILPGWSESINLIDFIKNSIEEKYE